MYSGQEEITVNEFFQKIYDRTPWGNDYLDSLIDLMLKYGNKKIKRLAGIQE